MKLTIVFLSLMQVKARELVVRQQRYDHTIGRIKKTVIYERKFLQMSTMQPLSWARYYRRS
jgi:hypothetical protein